MRNFLRCGVIWILMGCCLSLSAQKKESAYQKLYYEAGILEQNAIYDVAKQYYYDALRAVPDARNAREVKNQIKAKIQLMECYLRFYDLWGQGQQLDSIQDFESAYKYFEDALQYLDYEGLAIPNKDSLRTRSQLVGQTSELCKSLCLIELLNSEGKYSEARNLYHQWVNQVSGCRDSWNKYRFPAEFIQKVDSVARFLTVDRSVSLPYRTCFPEEYSRLDNTLFRILDKVACQNLHSVELDVSFEFSLDTNGVLEYNVIGDPIDERMKTALMEETANERLRQPYRYGFTLPVNEVYRYHLSSNRQDAWVQKTKKEYKVKNIQLNRQYVDEIRAQLSDAPCGKYYFVIYENVIDDNSRSLVRLVQAKGGKAEKWLKLK